MSAEPAEPALPLPVPALVPVPRRGFWFHRRSLPCPTWRLWLCTLLLGTGLLVLAGRHLHPWLAVTEPVPDARYLVVEGWVPDHVLNATISIAEDNATQRVFCTGLPLERGSFLVQWKTYADVTAQSLARLGLEPQLICPVPSADVKTERTRAMATALKAILDHEPVPDTGRKINIVTLGTHARRSRAIFQDVLGPDWQVGVISVPPLSYDTGNWFRQSEGAKNVINEITALTLMMAGGN